MISKKFFFSVCLLISRHDDAHWQYDVLHTFNAQLNGNVLTNQRESEKKRNEIEMKKNGR